MRINQLNTKEQEFAIRGLLPPMNLNVDFKPSERQYELFKCLMPNSCNLCGGELERQPRVTSVGVTSYLPVCKHCGNDNIPQMILAGGAAGGGKSFLGCSWVGMMCIQFAGIRAVIARKTLTSLTDSTWKTLLEVLDGWGLIKDINYKTNDKTGTLTLWNGSTILKKELEWRPSDAKYERLGSSEYTIAFIDEVSEVAQKGVEVLMSRLRYKVTETMFVPKMLMSTNPSDNWVRDRFVQDKEGNAIELRRNEAYVRFSVYDNPKEDFVKTYVANLVNISDPETLQRLLFGNWDYLPSPDNTVYNQFDGDTHLVTNLMAKKYNPLKPIIFTWDFNVIPYMSVSMFQIDFEKKEILLLKEFLGTPKDKTNSTPSMARTIASYMKTLGHAGGFIITGDPSGKQRSTASEVGVNNYTIINDEISNLGMHATETLLSKTPPQKTRCEFVNKIFDGSAGWNIYIDMTCRQTTTDMMFQPKNPDGTKDKRPTLDPITKTRYEKYGHFSDNLDYTVILFLNKEFYNYMNGNMSAVKNGNGNPLDVKMVTASSRPKFNF